MIALGLFLAFAGLTGAAIMRGMPFTAALFAFLTFALTASFFPEAP